MIIYSKLPRIFAPWVKNKIEIQVERIYRVGDPKKLEGCSWGGGTEKGKEDERERERERDRERCGTKLGDRRGRYTT